MLGACPDGWHRSNPLRLAGLGGSIAGEDRFQRGEALVAVHGERLEPGARARYGADEDRVAVSGHRPGFFPALDLRILILSAVPFQRKRASKLEKGIAVKDRRSESPGKSHRLDGAKERHAAPENPLIGRVRDALSGRIDFQEKRMFGGVTFMVREKMCISAGKGRIMCRIDPDIHESALERQGCRPVIMKGVSIEDMCTWMPTR